MEVEGGGGRERVVGLGDVFRRLVVLGPDGGGKDEDCGAESDVGRELAEAHGNPFLIQNRTTPRRPGMTAVELARPGSITWRSAPSENQGVSAKS